MYNKVSTTGSLYADKAGEWPLCHVKGTAALLLLQQCFQQVKGSSRGTLQQCVPVHFRSLPAAVDPASARTVEDGDDNGDEDNDDDADYLPSAGDAATGKRGPRGKSGGSKPKKPKLADQAGPVPPKPSPHDPPQPAAFPARPGEGGTGATGLGDGDTLCAKDGTGKAPAGGNPAPAPPPHGAKDLLSTEDGGRPASHLGLGPQPAEVGESAGGVPRTSAAAEGDPALAPPLGSAAGAGPPQPVEQPQQAAAPFPGKSPSADDGSADAAAGKDAGAASASAPANAPTGATGDAAVALNDGAQPSAQPDPVQHPGGEADSAVAAASFVGDAGRRSTPPSLPPGGAGADSGGLRAPPNSATQVGAGQRVGMADESTAAADAAAAAPGDKMGATLTTDGGSGNNGSISPNVAVRPKRSLGPSGADKAAAAETDVPAGVDGEAGSAPEPIASAGAGGSKPTGQVDADPSTDVAASIVGAKQGAGSDVVAEKASATDTPGAVHAVAAMTAAKVDPAQDGPDARASVDAPANLVGFHRAQQHGTGGHGSPLLACVPNSSRPFEFGACSSIAPALLGRPVPLLSFICSSW